MPHAQGRGQFVDVAMYDGIVALWRTRHLSIFLYRFVPDAEGNKHPILCPFGVFAASDGQVTIGCPRDTIWGRTRVHHRPTGTRSGTLASPPTISAGHRTETVEIVRRLDT